MKRVFALLLAAFMSLSLFAACGADSTDSDKLQIVTTIFPPYDFAREVAGDRADITMLLSPGAESHSYDPSPRDIIKIQNCDLFIYGGGESDAWVDSILDSIDRDIPTIAMMDVVEVLEEEIVEGMENQDDGHDDHGSDEDEEYDEHVWTSPVNAKKIVKAIADALMTIDAEGTSDYKSNSDGYLAKLDDLDSTLRAATSGGSRDTIIFGDRYPFRYLSEEYGLTYYAAFPGCSTETEPSAATVAFLIDKVKAERIPVVFQIEFSNGKMADTITEETGAKKLLLHSCHNVTKDDFQNGVTYLQLMEQNAQNLKEALA